MTIACTRCGATCDGDIIVPPLAFGFKHEPGCGHGVGPLAVLPGNKKADKPKTQKVETKVEAKVEPKEIKVEETVKESKPQKKIFGRISKKE